jgi:hypothetical protein
MNGEQSARKSVPEHGAVAIARVKLRTKPRRDVAQRLRHDLRSAVHALLGYANLLVHESHGALSAEQRRFAGYVRAAALDVEQLVDLCVALTVPAAGGVDAALAVVLQGARQKLTANGVACSEWPLELPCSPGLLARDAAEQAVVTLGEGLRSSGAEPLDLHVEARDGATVVVLHGPNAGSFSPVDAVEHELENRAFVRLKLAELMLDRIGATLRVSLDGRAAELTFR